MTDEQDRNERIAAIQARQDARTPGVWSWSKYWEWGPEEGLPDDMTLWGESGDLRRILESSRYMPSDADADMIANAPADIEFLMAEVARLVTFIDRQDPHCTLCGKPVYYPTFAHQECID